MTNSRTRSGRSQGKRSVTDTKNRATRVVQLPISATEWAALQAPFPLTEERWAQMLAVLNAMKPALVAESDDEEPGD